MKPLIDGIIAAFHGHIGGDERPIDRVAQSLHVSVDSVRSALMSSDRNILGDRVLLRPFGAGVQWNPADDRLVAIEMRHHDAARLEVSGQLHEAVAVPPEQRRSVPG